MTTSGGKEETTQAKEKAKATTKEAKAKASTGAKDTTRDLTKAIKEATTKEDTTRAKEKATQDPKAMDQARATRVKETTAKQNDMAPMWQAWPLGPGLQIGEGEELHSLAQEQADQDNNEALPQDVNDTWDWYDAGEEGLHEVNYMEENWNDYCDNSWDWSDNRDEDTANYIGGINESHLTIGRIRQAKSLLRKHKSKSLLGKKTTHNIMERPQQELSTSPPRGRNATALQHNSSNTIAKKQED